MFSFTISVYTIGTIIIIGIIKVASKVIDAIAVVTVVVIVVVVAVTARASVFLPKLYFTTSIKNKRWYIPVTFSVVALSALTLARDGGIKLLHSCLFRVFLEFI